MGAAESIVKPDGTTIERVVHPLSKSRSRNKGKVKYKREWWRVHRTGADKTWRLKEPLGGEYRVYVLELKKQVWDREKKLRERNPGYQKGKPLVYVGHTSGGVDERIGKHLGGIRSSPYVRKYFKRRLPQEYEALPIVRSRAKALRLEARTADDLRSRGWGVWEGRVEDLRLQRAE